MKLLFTAMLLTSCLAFAGKEERDFMKNKVTPALQGATKGVKEACGCDIKVNFNSDSFKTTDKMEQSVYQLQSYAEEAKKYCTDADSKKAVCKIKTIEIKLGKESKVSFASGKATVESDGSSAYGFEAVAKEADK